VGGCSESVVPNLSRKGPIHGQHGAVTGELTTRFRGPRPARVAPELLFDAHIEAISRPDFSAEINLAAENLGDRKREIDGLPCSIDGLVKRRRSIDVAGEV